MLGEEREIGRAARNGFEQIDAAHQRRLGIRRALRGLRERRHHAVEAPA